ncbi:MAG: hypothetical protein ACLRSW_06065 [Christensenellaceae bacterium]
MNNTFGRRVLSVLLAAAMLLGLSYSFLLAFSSGKAMAQTASEGPHSSIRRPRRSGWRTNRHIYRHGYGRRRLNGLDLSNCTSRG